MKQATVKKLGLKSNLSKYSYVNKNGRKIKGAAAVAHKLKELGGIDHVLEQTAEEAYQLGQQTILKELFSD